MSQMTWNACAHQGRRGDNIYTNKLLYVLALTSAKLFFCGVTENGYWRGVQHCVAVALVFIK